MKPRLAIHDTTIHVETFTSPKNDNLYGKIADFKFFFRLSSHIIFSYCITLVIKFFTFGKPNINLHQTMVKINF